jgi:hypothetical protein
MNTTTKHTTNLIREIGSLRDLIRRIAKAHNISHDVVIHEVELTLIEDDNFTRERYLGVYRTLRSGTQARLNIPNQVSPAEEYHVLLTEWGDLIYRPVSPHMRARPNPIIEAS